MQKTAHAGRERPLTVFARRENENFADIDLPPCSTGLGIESVLYGREAIDTLVTRAR